jgi:hypothetical protein
MDLCPELEGLLQQLLLVVRSVDDHPFASVLPRHFVASLLPSQNVARIVRPKSVALHHHRATLLELLVDAQLAHHPRRIGRNLDARSHRLKLGRSLEHDNFQPLLPTGNGACQPANARADDDHLQVAIQSMDHVC